MATNFHLAPPAKTVDGLLAVPIDIDHIEAKLHFDSSAQTGTGDATISFVLGPTGGYPVFDLRQDITGLWLDGASLPVSAAAHHDFGGGPHAELRVLASSLPAGTAHTLRVTYDLSLPAASTAGSYAPGMTFSAGPRLEFNFGFTDLGAGRYLEAWVPANLVFDQFTLGLEIEIVNAGVGHTLITNGSTTTLGTHHWRATFPARTTALSPLVEVRPSDSVASSSGTVTLPVSGKTVAIDVWKLASSNVNLATQIANIAAYLTANESSTGPYLHGHRFVAFIHTGGMEYDGGTTTSTGPLRHETFHSWWARGLKPASQPDAWFDEAWTTYYDFGAAGSVPFDFSDPPTTLAPRNPWIRVTAGGSYSDGRRVFDGIAAMIGAANLRSLMSEFYQLHQHGPPVTTEQIEEFLICRTGAAALVDGFARFVYGYTSSGGDLWLRDEVGHAGTEHWSGRFWDSPDLWIRNEDDGGTTHQDPAYGQDNWFHARVRNGSSTATAQHFVTTFNVKSFAGTEFTYPGDFLPCIAAAADHGLGPGETRVVKARWPAADVPPPGAHACLTAAVIHPGDHPIGGRHVWEHGNLAQKNLNVVDLAPGDWVLLPFLLRNPWPRARKYFLEIRRPRGWASLKAGLLQRSGAVFGLPASELRGHVTRLPIGDATYGGCNPREAHLPITSRRPHTSASAALAGAVDVSFKTGRVAAVPVKLTRFGQAHMGLRLEVPRKARVGSSMTFDLVKRDARTGRALGGVAVRVNVVKG